MAEIRVATPEDAQALEPLFAQVGYPTPAATIAARLSKLGDGAVVFVAADAKRLSGFIALVIESEFLVAPQAVVVGLVVDEGARGNGLGARLLRAGESWAAQHGLECVLVRSNVIRERAHRFYEREGYARFKTQHNFRRSLRIMKKL